MSDLLVDDVNHLLDTVGYAVVEDLLDVSTVVQPVLDAFAARISEYARLHHGRSYASLDLESQIIRLVADGQDWVGTSFDVALPPGGPFRVESPMFLEPEMFALLSNEKLLDVLERVLGPNIWLSPVAHTRTKVPQSIAPKRNQRLGDVAWHQDNGVVLEEADAVDILTVWISLTDAPLERAPLRVHPTPRRADILDHCIGGHGGLIIARSQMPSTQEVPVPMRRGSALFMHSRIPHASLPNTTTDRVRISLDLRYQPVEKPNGRPWMPSFLLRGSDAAGTPITTYEQWRDTWLATRRSLAERTEGATFRFNRWDPDAEVCA